MNAQLEAVQGRLQRVQVFLQQINPPTLALILAVVLFFIGGIGNPDILNIDQAINIVRLAAFLGIIAAGQTLVILSGGEGIDLSAGSVVTLGMIVTFVVTDGDNGRIIHGLVATLLIGGLVGFGNGLGIIVFKIPPLVMTLGMTGVVEGSIQAYFGGEIIGGTPELLSDMFADPLIGQIPGVIPFWILFGIGIWLVLTRTLYGKQLFAIGTNRTTAQLSGVKVQRMVWLTFTISGMLAAFGGFMLLSFTKQAFVDTGESAERLFRAIAAVVIGGTVLAGGRGSYWGTMAGALVLQVINSVLQAQGYDKDIQFIIVGGTLIALTSLFGRESRLRQ